MVRIPYIKIPSVRVGSIDPTSDIGTGGATPAPPTPITYLTQWKIVGNSEVHTLPYPDGIVLPNDYKRCEYIETRGAGYINLNYNTLYSYEVKAVAQSIDNTNGILIFNGQTAAQYFGCSKDGYWAVGGTTGTSDVISTEPTIINLSFTNNGIEFTINGVSISRQGTAATSNFRLFSNYSNQYLINGKVWYLKAFDGDTLVHHWVPCLDANDVPCMYDVVEKQTYYNAGAGTFYYKLYPQPTEIWSCGEYSAVDGKWHILVQPLGGSIADIALTEPLRMANNVIETIADTIEFPGETVGKALVTRNLKQIEMITLSWQAGRTNVTNANRYYAACDDVYNYDQSQVITALTTADYNIGAGGETYNGNRNDSVIGQYDNPPRFYIFDVNHKTSYASFKSYISDKILIYRLATPTTELVDAPQIEEADSYSMVISQGAKAVEWTSFITNSE